MSTLRADQITDRAGTGAPSFPNGATVTGPSRGPITVNGSLTFNLATGNNFSRTMATNGTLTFTNIAAGQSGYILLVNPSNLVVSAAATTKVDANFLSIVSGTGTYAINYFSDGTNVYCVTSGAMV